MQDTYLTRKLAQRQSYGFNLPSELIATEPVYPKESARLLVYNKGEIIHATFKSFFDFAPKSYRIILNNTKVIKARFYASKLKTGARREFLYHEALSEDRHLAQIKGKSAERDEYIIHYPDSNPKRAKILIKILKIRDDGFREISFHMDNTTIGYSQVLDILQECGEIPLPPYMKRKATKQDDIDYQSVFANAPGALAAPTASLHFSHNMFEYLQGNYNCAFITLHVGAGTFMGVKAPDIRDHKMHSEYCVISREAQESINSQAKILCVGTTALRSAEWFARYGKTEGKNDIFLNPFNPPRRADALLTNFHLPESSLIMLVSGMIGLDQTMKIYNEAIKLKYRFYSYGDCMLII